MLLDLISSHNRARLIPSSWALMKNKSLGLSTGFLLLKGTPSRGEVVATCLCQPLTLFASFAINNIDYWQLDFFKPAINK